MLRHDASVTQTELAARLGRPQSFVAKVEGGERRIDVLEFVDWLDALDASDKAPALLRELASIQPVSNKKDR